MARGANVPDYGQVWTPLQDPDWAPYRDGRWVYEPYYGWTWVSYEPWGWAPYHYGRWFVYGGNWGWWPGPVAAYPGYYPIWAPAYVSFFGFGGGGWGLSFGFGFGGWGRVGWLPVRTGGLVSPVVWRVGRRYGAVGVGAFGRFHEGFSPLGNGRFSNFDAKRCATTECVAGFHRWAGNEFGRGAVSMHQERISEAILPSGQRDDRENAGESFARELQPERTSGEPSTIRGGSRPVRSISSPATASDSRERMRIAVNPGSAAIAADRFERQPGSGSKHREPGRQRKVRRAGIRSLRRRAAQIVRRDQRQQAESRE